jgi:tetratricopeptide (TPR) repeat protein
MKSGLLGATLALLLGSLLAAPVRADSLPEIYARGNAAYARGDYGSAIKEYETLEESGVSDADVSYNLACAYASAGKYGPAIRFFERALRRSPGDDDAERGLKLARDLLGERQAKERGEAIVAERPPLSRALFAAVSEDALALTLLASSVLGSLTLLALLAARAEALRLGLGIAGAFFALLAGVSAFGVGAKTDFGAEGRRAVVLVDRAPLREGPDPNARLAAELSEGESVRVLAQEGPFAHVRLSRGSEGFVPRSAVGEI